jgi:KUP system potassium uptake protein
LTVDLALFSANALKIPSGGWFPLVIGLVVFTIMTTRRAGRRLVLTRLASETVPLANFLATCETAPEARVWGTGVFLTAQTGRLPSTLLRKPQAQQGAASDGAAGPSCHREHSPSCGPRPDQGARARRGFLTN